MENLYIISLMVEFMMATYHLPICDREDGRPDRGVKIAPGVETRPALAARSEGPLPGLRPRVRFGRTNTKWKYRHARLVSIRGV